MRKRIRDVLYDERFAIRERVFVLLMIVLSISFAFFIISNAVTGTTVRDTLILSGTLILLGVIAWVSFRKKKLKLGSAIISALTAFVLLPYTFFSAGGVNGGPPIWFMFSVLFVSLMLSGKTRVIFLICNLVSAGTCYGIAYAHPEFVSQNTTETAYIDSFEALVFISVSVCIIIGFEIVLYQRENKRSEQRKKEIEALIASQNSFFSSMSHEIRTPINTIVGLNEMILREDVSDEVAEDAANIQAASKMLLHLINDILDMSKLESGNMQLTPTTYYIGDTLSELVGMFWGRAKAKGLEFHVKIAPDVPAELFGDDVRIKQILINVLNNAIKYTNEGSVTLSVQCGIRTRDSQSIIYTVSDTGIGIKKENIPYLFTAFRRVDEQRNRHIEGTGLGLSIVKQLVDLMGGIVTVNSIYTQGSTFIIDIPQQIASKDTVGTLNMEEKHKSSRSDYHPRFEAPDAKILVVDDNSSNLLVVTKLLRGTKVQTDTASSGEEALRMTLEKNYQIILMDHLMPEMDGVECRRRIINQTGGKCRESKILALTANADSESRALYEREGFDGYLAKPISGDSLEREIYFNLPKELIHTVADDNEELLKESMAWIQSQSRKSYVAVTTETVADLPRELLERNDIAEIPHLVITEKGTFRDTIDLESNGLLVYMSDPNHKVSTSAPDVATHERFFAEQLNSAYNIVHIALSSGIGNSAYPAAVEAAASFNNVAVFDSGHLSSGMGLQVLEACRLSKEGKSAADIVKHLEETKDLVQTSFIVDNLDYLARAGQVNSRIAKITKSLALRPILVVKNGKMTVGEVCIGSRRHSWKKYIASCF
ncbi:MAG: DegV family EDD domain-containing protein, partial [Clostridia bacterium]|nr:DegV family EDD domain-containing protein [Clostridia bacterium]